MSVPIPTGRTAAPAPGHAASYSDPTFPSLHIRPTRGWLNDPNGLSYVDGTYHVFFQYNPDSARHGAIRWGHASSVDLLHWRQEPIALVPRPGRADSFGCWSGVVTVDGGVPTAVYSGVMDAGAATQVLLAHSDRAMRDWVQEDESVIGMPPDPRLSQVRDPFILTAGGHRWALQGAALDNGTSTGNGAVLAYACDDLHAWTYLGVLLDGEDVVAARHAPAKTWECPQLVLIDGAWVLIVSPVTGEDPTPFGPVAWLTGQLTADDGRLTFTPTSGGVLDSGPAFYAPQVLALPDRTLMWGWSFENGRSPENSDEVGWAGVLTFPRELRFIDGTLTSSPIRELSGLRGGTIFQGTTESGPALIHTGAFEVELTARSGVNLQLGLTHDDAASGSAGTGPSGSGSPESHTTVGDFAVPVGSTARIILDGSIVEVFVDGQAPRTLRAYPAPGQIWRVQASGATEITVWELRLPA